MPSVLLRIYALSFFLAMPIALQAAPCANPDALGTFRSMQVGTSGGLAVGLKTYPQTLKLADHEVVLTFDDGPSAKTTPHVLDALKHECIEATFFLIGRNAAANPQLVRRELAEGHTLGHHTFSHPFLRGMPLEKAEAEILKGFAADEAAAYGAAANPDQLLVPFFRFPGFADSEPILAWLAARNIGVFGADLWASDWVPMAPEAQQKLLFSRLDRAGRGIILLHDIHAQTAAMLPGFLHELKKRGYHVVHLIPGPGTADTIPAPKGWSSETDTIISGLAPKLRGFHKPAENIAHAEAGEKRL